MTMNRHESWEELVSASLHGDLTAEERRRLDAHLDGCEHCRATMAAFADTRRIVAGLRHVSPPRDLGARVRAGIEMDAIPWWRRPAVMFTAVGGSLAAVAGALLALVLLNGAPSEPNVGQLSQTPIPATPAPSLSAEPATSAPAATLPPPETPAPGETPGPEPTTDPEATPNPIAHASPEPDLYVAMVGTQDEQALTVIDPETQEPIAEPEPTAALGPPIAAELSAAGGWLAVIAEMGQSGMNELSVTRVADAIRPDDPDATPIPEPSVALGESISLGRSVAGSPFLERLAWSPDGSYLAYTIADPAGGGTDVWLFDRQAAQARQLTEVGDAYAASWAVLGDDGEAEGNLALWVSRAGETVRSYLVSPTDESGAPVELIDPSANPIAVAEGIFQPLVSPNGALAIYWDGRMDRRGEEWVFVEGGAPQLSEHRPEGANGAFPSARPLFSDVMIDRDAFTSAAIAWGVDSNAYAVWATAWTGLPQSEDPEQPYPDPSRVYFGHASDPRGLTRFHAIDRADLPPDWAVIDVKVSPTGRHLVITVARPRAGELDPPTAELLLITRNTGTVADEVEKLRADEGMWYGPAVFDAYVELPGEGQTEVP